jgi:arylsulfatase A-like enzyme
MGGLTQALLHNASVGLRDSEVTLAEALKTRGYRTAIVGKWHLGDKPEYNPTRHGFDRFFGLPYSNDIMSPWVAGAPPVPLFSDTTVVEQPVNQPTLTARYTAEAVRLMREAGNQPFFVYVAYSMPHLPISASDRFRGTSRGGRYGDVIEELDWSAGEILKAIGDLGLDRNTLVVFMSDNGPWLNAGPRMMQGGVEPWDVGSPGSLRGSKGTTYEAGFRVPGIFRWPGTIPGGQESAEMASNLDVFPTVLRAAGAAAPSDRPIDGHDILPMLQGRAPSASSEFFYFAGTRLEAVREGPWKLRVAAPVAPAPEEPELFDLEVDPGERYNVASSHADVVTRLRARMQTFAASVTADRTSAR